MLFLDVKEVSIKLFRTLRSFMYLIVLVLVHHDYQTTLRIKDNACPIWIIEPFQALKIVRAIQVTCKARDSDGTGKV